MQTTREQIIELANFLDKVADEIPQGQGLSELKDAVSFACIDLRMHLRGVTGPRFQKALHFAQSIPKVDDVEDDKLTRWMIHDEKYLEYFP